MLLGDPMADALGVDKFSLFHYLYMTCFFLFIRLYKILFVPFVIDNGKIAHWKYNMLKRKVDKSVQDINSQINLSKKKEN
jgi:hypothetical protein